MHSLCLSLSINLIQYGCRSFIGRSYMRNFTRLLAAALFCGALFSVAFVGAQDATPTPTAEATMEATTEATVETTMEATTEVTMEATSEVTAAATSAPTSAAATTAPTATLMPAATNS